MRDSRVEKLAYNLINYSVRLKSGERILIEMIGSAKDLVKALVAETKKVGGIPFVTIKDPEITKSLLINSSKEQIEDMASFEIPRMEKMQAYIGIRAGDNVSEMSSVPSDNMTMYMKHYQKPLHSEIRVPKTKWCILRYPNASMAQLANTSTDDFEEFYFNVCNLDYSKMSKAMDNLVELMQKTDRVRLVAKDTDLTFSIKGLPAIKCAGSHNIPDGEVFTAPVKESINGVITYNTPSPHDGVTYENIRLEFKNGKIINATANETEKINKVFDTDEGARYVGEFAIGVNPYIEKPMKDILFDEKIKGSIHFTPGCSYDDCDNGNKSAIHWDLVLIQRPEYGGGEIWFDDVLIRKDGVFVVDSLKCLNPENLTD